MATIKLGKLQEVDIRKLWNHEQYDFSEWLSKPENLEQLNEAIGLTLSEVEKEVYVGSCHAVKSGSVLIGAISMFFSDKILV
ncbi:hypothetical protein [Butyrivibrio sp. WCD2001]|uniref:hypothetical protein n=1 Tax=Butyrivibrio sp. WCD2001 TaxID=1280681 RepID=UPI00041AC6B5|nr:hypothetical protein [Butyrivibrio sp. WCD2001]